MQVALLERTEEEVTQEESMVKAKNVRQICTLAPGEHEVDARCDLPHGWRLSAPATNETIQQSFTTTPGPVGIDIPDEGGAGRTCLAAVRVFGEKREERAALIVQAVNRALATA